MKNAGRLCAANTAKTDTLSEILKILYADDDADDRYLFRAALEELHLPFQLLEFENGILLEKALESETGSNLIFLDINMPQKNGLETLTSLKQDIKEKQLKIIVFTTTGSEELIRATHGLNAVRFVRKPSDFNELIATLKILVSHAPELRLPVSFDDYNFKLEK